MDATNSTVDTSYTLVEVKQFKKLPPGTQIAIKGSFENLDPTLAYFYPLFSSDKYYYHHGVCLKDEKVAHFSGENKADAKPRRCYLLEFSNGAVDKKLYRVDYNNPASEMPIDDTLRRANEAIENPQRWPGYQLLNNNCETFATWLKTGVKTSAQATAATSQIVDHAAAATATAAAVGSIAMKASK